jgi:hypothetical protein
LPMNRNLFLDRYLMLKSSGLIFSIMS